MEKRTSPLYRVVSNDLFELGTDYDTLEEAVQDAENLRDCGYSADVYLLKPTFLKSFAPKRRRRAHRALDKAQTRPRIGTMTRKQELLKLHPG